jgi:DNA-directed RNA polymerase subunit RPC12/RpoP
MGINPCSHEIDDKQIPEWNPHTGKVYTCIKCGAKVVKDIFWKSAEGKKLHLSKKNRRRRREAMLRGELNE